ncbi:hypothetical protein MJO28_003598 [Puccinia striiformis f. sp. tritici]|uniref:Cytochrome b5 heme-binding domain-containing protein n=2 Tax=Puccinia striiformis f. sp. tritici TaxID=168172 RepID=A0A0L0VI86_9BASI|nr:hypothetical protein Pst134EB_008860 [Puccinia striiformis f. sp. tritici]KAI7956503.1 hypothetical protein MJO28_003598 [Puccinia striiformis f. sp. tritici]KAI9625151.1 hypothetical protein KEM48_008550 [Puccinia striiformis f. sp. tritici PST-130]KNE98958.1 hypothetical protein PSTG_07802 [Puccinia striiformis f. sp. tritici PST-78]
MPVIKIRKILISITIILTTISGIYLLFFHHEGPIFISPIQSTMTKIISIQEVEKHKDEKSAWTIVEGKVYDVTEFLEEHPGGKKILLKNCGKDSTELFHQYHTKKILKNVAGPMMIGQVTSEAKL